ncbi:unnamed protein product [Camellia sinensis]
MAFGDGGDYESQKMLDVYIYDYLMKRNRHEVAAIFAREVNITISPLVIDSPTGFLSEWWSIFWDVYSARIPASHLAMPSGPSVQAAQRVVNEQLNKSPNVPKPNVNHQNSGKLPSPDFDNNMMGQSVATVNHQSFGKLPMSPGLDNNEMGQSSATSVNHHNFGKLPMSLDFDNNMMGQSVASVNHLNYGKLPMSPSFNNNMMGQSFVASVNHQNSGKLPTSPGFDNNMMGQFAASVDHQNFGTLPMSPDFDDNLMRQYATNVNDQNFGKLPMSHDFDNSLMGQFAASVNYQNSRNLHMNSSFDSNMMGQSATSVNYQNSTKLPMTLDFNSNLMGQSSAASVFASNLFAEEHSKIPAKDSNSIMRLLDVDNCTLSKASLSHASNSQPQIPERVVPQQTARDNNYGVAFGGTSSGVAFGRTSSSVSLQGTSSMDSSLFVVPKPLVPRAESHDAGLYRILLLCALLEKHKAQQPHC